MSYNVFHRTRFDSFSSHFHQNMQNEKILDIKIRVSVPQTKIDHIELKFQMSFVHPSWLPDRSFIQFIASSEKIS